MKGDGARDREEAVEAPCPGEVVCEDREVVPPAVVRHHEDAPDVLSVGEASKAVQDAGDVGCERERPVLRCPFNNPCPLFPRQREVRDLPSGLPPLQPDPEIQREGLVHCYQIPLEGNFVKVYSGKNHPHCPSRLRRRLAS